MRKDIVIFVCCLLILTCVQSVTKKLTGEGLGWYLIISLMTTAIVKLSEWSWGKAVFKWQFKDTMNKLEGESLRLYANEHRGLPFTTQRGLGADAIRYLITLQVIRAEVFPGSLDYIYYLTDLGRRLLTIDMRYSLYPEIFCDMRLISFWKGYNEKGFKDFDKQRMRFKNEYQISWLECCAVLRKQLQEKGFKINDTDDDVVKMFDDYQQGKVFLSIMADLIEPWRATIDSKRRRIVKLFNPL